MERCTKKFDGVREIEVVESAELIGGDGASTRTPAAARDSNEEPDSEMAEKRSREVADGELDFADSAFVETRSTRRRVVIEATAESSSPADGSASCGPLTSLEEKNSVCEAASCCFSSPYVDLVVDRFTLDDPTGRAESAQSETLTFSIGRTRAGSTPATEKSSDLDSTAANSCQKSTTTEMPSESEIEEFFSAAEKTIQKRFTERYNFDFGKGVPLKGRYEWVPVKP